ncbi:MAG TPA: 2-hydroxyacid dehydrogenase [Pseudolabrys sp.]|uniref:2-hydroxyacid dehydrogenase n=1 Tax=Pseudolabrys sp. TaxID=1960880 RepID=UPI002DDD2CBA|nr:2-hydroxyacid dehydrogenase [Pseudolabrys sp.]HEV2631450.1 2-hydroxyacid dehydrogenase [Pseudolabrys sp.]
MAGAMPDVLLVGNKKPVFMKGFEGRVTLHHWLDLKDKDAFVEEHGGKIRAMAIAYTANKVDGTFMSQFPKLEQISSFGVGYDHIDAKWSGEHGIVVTNTPDVLNEEVADTALGLLLCTVREFPQADRYVRDGKWPSSYYPLSKATLRNRTVGMVGMGRIGRAIARRLEAFGVPVVYHSRNPQTGVAYKYYPKLLDMARDVDTLMVIVPGGASTKNMINAEVLKALGPTGIVVNMARGSVIDEPALIEALKNRTIYSAGLDVFVNEPHVPKELLEMEHIVLFPHLGSASEATREAMDQLVVDNILAWAAGKPPLTPVAETPFPPKR